MTENSFEKVTKIFQTESLQKQNQSDRWTERVERSEDPYVKRAEKQNILLGLKARQGIHPRLKTRQGKDKKLTGTKHVMIRPILMKVISVFIQKKIKRMTINIKILLKRLWLHMNRMKIKSYTYITYV